ncbi:MAG: hypothetical protein ABIT76_09815 [Chthoniobacterales bacterium]
MEYYQAYQTRATQTVAVINQYISTLTVGGFTVTDLSNQSTALDALAQTRDNALADYDLANNAENQGFLLISGLTLSLPQSAEGELSDNIEAESPLLDLLSSAYAIKPRTTALALDRGKKVVAALTKINAYLAALPTPRAPITSGGKGMADLSAAMTAQPQLEQIVEDRAADVTEARSTLRNAAVAVDRLNKRFYSKLQSEARSNPALADALGQIVTEGSNLPGTLGIRSLLQGGTDNLHILLSYENASYDGTATSTVEWQIVGTDQDFAHSVAADPSGNALGPFVAGQTVKLRTRVSNANGTTTGSVRTLTLVAA